MIAAEQRAKLSDAFFTIPVEVWVVPVRNIITRPPTPMVNAVKRTTATIGEIALAICLFITLR